MRVCSKTREDTVTADSECQVRRGNVIGRVKGPSLLFYLSMEMPLPKGGTQGRDARVKTCQNRRRLWTCTVQLQWCSDAERPDQQCTAYEGVCICEAMKVKNQWTLISIYGQPFFDKHIWLQSTVYKTLYCDSVVIYLYKKQAINHYIVILF